MLLESPMEALKQQTERWTGAPEFSEKPETDSKETRERETGLFSPCLPLAHPHLTHTYPLLVK